MTQFFSELLKISGLCLEILHHTQRYYFFSIISHKKKFWIAHKFPDSNATLLPGFFSLWPRAATYCGWPLSAQAGDDPWLQGALTGLSAAAGGAGGPGGHCQHPG